MIEETLKKLSDYQIQALKKGIAFDLAIDFNGNKIPVAEVHMRYSVTGGITKGYAFSTTFSDAICDSKTEDRLNSINHFISTVTEPTE